MISTLKLEQATLHVTLATNAMLRRENRKHRHINKSTDVLSFPSFPPQKAVSFYKNKFLGDILISLDQAQEQARVQNISLADEVLFLVIHSLLHLMGHDHGKPAETKRMHELESWLWGVVHD